MASIGLAMVQGQKNAQDMATGQMAALTNMARSAVEADKMHEYMDPVMQAQRERVLRDAGATLAAKERLDLFAPAYAKDPAEGAAQAYKSVGLEVVPQSGSSAYGVYDSATGELKGMYSNKNQLASASMDAVTGNQTVMEKIRALADAEKVVAAKLAYERGKDQSTYANLKAPEFESLERRTKMATEAEKASAAIHKSGVVESASIGKTDSGEDRLKAVDKGLAAKGITYDKDNKYYLHGTEFSLLPEATRNAAYAEMDKVRYAVAQSARTNNPAITPAAVIEGEIERRKAPTTNKSVGLPSAKEALSSIEVGRRIAAQRLAERRKKSAEDAKAAADKAEYYRIQQESDPNYKPRFY